MDWGIDINRNDKIVFKSLYDMPQWIRHHGILRVDARRAAGKTFIVSHVGWSIYGKRFKYIMFTDNETGVEGTVQVCEEMVDYVVRNADVEEEYEDSDDLTIFIDGFVKVP